MDINSLRYRIAFHEVGHVMCVLDKGLRRLDSVRLYGDKSGSVKHEPNPAVSHPTSSIDQAREVVVISFGGRAADDLLRGRYAHKGNWIEYHDWDCGYDEDERIRKAQFARHPELVAEYDELEKRSDRIVHRNYRFMHCLALALLKSPRDTLSGSDVAELMSAHKRQARIKGWSLACFFLLMIYCGYSLMR